MMQSNRAEKMLDTMGTLLAMFSLALSALILAWAIYGWSQAG